MRSLSSLGSRISLIERSHLGEFSWPFAEAIREIAETLFVEPQIDGDHPPIVHVISEGMDYQIVDDESPPTGERRIIIVAFPRQLKHYVLLHSIFGHELAHTAINAPGPGLIIRTSVMPALTNGSPLQDATQLLTWFKHEKAPASLRADLDKQQGYAISETTVRNWRIEIVCDLFGLLLFGPAFAAAHRTIIEALCANPSSIDLRNSTHPPYAIRQRIISSAIKVLGWHVPVSEPENELLHRAETAFLEYVTEAETDEWCSILGDERIESVLKKLSEVFKPFPGLAFIRPDAASLRELSDRLTLGRPPILQSLAENGVATNAVVPLAHCLYAGWSFWFGQKALQEKVRQEVPALVDLSFLETNRLCNYAILQQRAIDLVSRATK